MNRYFCRQAVSPVPFWRVTSAPGNPGVLNQGVLSRFGVCDTLVPFLARSTSGCSDTLDWTRIVESGRSSEIE